MTFDIKPLKSEGEDYLVLTNNTVDITLQRTEGEFKNLFNGNKVLGKLNTIS